eukprot:6798926-Karenia_brevis.AAC.1
MSLSTEIHGNNLWETLEGSSQSCLQTLAAGVPVWGNRVDHTTTHTLHALIKRPKQLVEATSRAKAARTIAEK